MLPRVCLQNCGKLNLVSLLGRAATPSVQIKYTHFFLTVVPWLQFRMCTSLGNRYMKYGVSRFSRSRCLPFRHNATSSPQMKYYPSLFLPELAHSEYCWDFGLKFLLIARETSAWKRSSRWIYIRYEIQRKKNPF